MHAPRTQASNVTCDLTQTLLRKLTVCVTGSQAEVCDTSEMKSMLKPGLFALILIFTAASAFAQDERPRTAKKANEAARQAEKAANVFDRIMATRERAIPRDLLNRAEAVAVFPGVLKAGFIVGGRGGRGVISRRVADGWSAPAFFNLAGGSVGLQI